MPVFKYKSLDEMRRAQQMKSGDPRLLNVLRLVWTRSWILAGRFVPPRGVFKFRSIEEANAHRRAWEDQRIALLKKRHKSDQPDTPK